MKSMFMYWAIKHLLNPGAIYGVRLPITFLLFIGIVTHQILHDRYYDGMRQCEQDFHFRLTWMRKPDLIPVYFEE